MSKENEVFTDDLVKRLRVHVMRTDYLSSAAADRIEELEAKLSKSEALLAKAVEALQSIKFECVGDSVRCGSRAALAELSSTMKGQDGE